MRLPGWDYRSPGPYGITIVTQHREWFFGEVVNQHMRLNPAGLMVQETWRAMPEMIPRIALDSAVVMPNHLHAIVWLSWDGPAGNPTLSEVVQRFKQMTTVRYSDGVHRDGWAPYDRRLWQRGFYDRIIDDRQELGILRAYIDANPANWQHDPDREPEPGADNPPTSPRG